MFLDRRIIGIVWFELMLSKESAHNLFRFLMCYDIDLHNIDGVLYDFSCGLDNYLLNREPKEFEFKRTLVDGLVLNGTVHG